MQKINEVIIVEGVHDVSFLKTFLEADFIITHGSSLPKETYDEIDFFKAQKRKFIILTDPDYPGTQIRNKLLEIIPAAAICFVEKEKAKTKKKVGIEHSTKNVILDALKSKISFSDYQEVFDKEDSMRYGLSGNENSSKLRKKVCDALKIGNTNSKQFLHRINSLGLSKEEIERKIEGILK